MSGDIDFHDVQLPVPLLQKLSTTLVLSERTFNAFSALLEAAFDHGGYIAGGFAALVGRYFARSQLSHPDRLSVSLTRHLGIDRGKWGRMDPTELNPFVRNAGRGDVDVWFPDAASLQAFRHDERVLGQVSRGVVWVGYTPTQSALEYVVDQQIRVQVITRYLAPMRPQLANFDIFNAMAGLTNTTLTLPAHWETLEDNGMLHVSTWGSPYTVNRVIKWYTRKGYSSVSPATAAHLYDETLRALDWAQATDVFSNPDPAAADVDKMARNKLCKAALVAPRRLQNLIKPILPQLAAEQLLQLSALCKAPIRYDWPMQEIRKRMQLATPI